MSTSSAMWIGAWVLVAILGACGVVASANNIRFQRRVEREASSLFAAVQYSDDPSSRAVASLPPPVRAYLTKAIGSRRERILMATLEQTGMFRPDLNGRWLPIRATQYFTADPPAFIWWGRVHLVPGLWIEARDKSVAGAGNMLIMIESTITLADASGPELDQGALLRLLGELVWLPTAFVDARYVQWAPIDDTHAKATIIVNGREASGVFEFKEDLPVRFTADRFRDIGGGKSVLTPFLGEYHDYRQADGWLVPHQLVGSWIVDGVAMPYARFNVAAISFNGAEAGRSTRR